MKKSIEVTGYTIKEENVDFLKHHIIPNTMVVNVNHPFPGYYGIPGEAENKPRSVLLVTKEKYSWEKILRAATKINKFTDFNIDATYAKISLGNNYYDSIRIKSFDSFDEIPIIQNALIEEGFKFMNEKKMKDDQTVVIKISKFYDIEEIGDGLYKDIDTENMYYISIPHQLNWELFRNLTLKIKNNISNRNYDAVLGVFFMQNGVCDMIRIYKPNASVELLNEIKNKYLTEMERYF